MQIDTTEARYGHRWWTVDELAGTGETVRPKMMAQLLPEVLTDGGRSCVAVHLGDFNEDTDLD
ncbi:hypothetical protein EV641_12729 [Rhodococcus sp. SMB37]|nr:hypothetical protein EV641_12729 [Rhodococcus sp. SMB37]